MHFIPRRKTSLIVAVEIELERFGFDQIGTCRWNRHFSDRHLGQAFLIEPRELIQRPNIAALKRQSRAKMQIIAVQAAWHRLQ
ncbi:Uncharacterised protein [Vibrio cholerae]|nr:Uncharacterised protein [Vibrio cholerae]CSD71021.1 Uncharacterised protein [Vibrio cholerae]